MIFAPIDKRSITYATSRLRDFICVQKNMPRHSRADSVALMSEALGFGDDQRQQLVGELEEVVDPSYNGILLLGVVLGLYMAEYETDISENPQLWRDAFE